MTFVFILRLNTLIKQTNFIIKSFKSIKIHFTNNQYHVFEILSLNFSQCAINFFFK